MSELRTEDERLAREAYLRLTGNQSFEDWLTVGSKLREITEQVMRELNLPEWDPNDRRLTREATARFVAWERRISNKDSLTKQERRALRELMTNSDITDWYRTLPEPTRRRLNHPHSVINRWKALKRGPPLSPSEHQSAFVNMVEVLRTRGPTMTGEEKEAVRRLFDELAGELKIVDVEPEQAPPTMLLLGMDEDPDAALQRLLRAALELFRAMSSEHRQAIHWWLTEEFVDLDLQAA